MMNPDRILIVEDEGIVAAHIETALGGLGYDVAGVASTGPEALEMAAALQPSLVLMDIKLRGGMDGIATAALLRERHDLPVVYLTAHTEDATLERAKQTEPLAYLAKPFHDSILKATLSMALHRRALDRRSRETERELRRSEEHYRLTFDQAAVGIAHVGLDLRIQQANPCLCAMTGYSMEELSGMSLVELIHPEDRLVAAEQRREVLAGVRPSHTTEKRYVRKDGSVFWGRVTASLRRDLEGRPMSAIGVMDDITVRREAEEKLRIVAEHALVGIAILQDSRIEFANQACADINGYSVEEMLAMPAVDFGRMVHPDDLAFALKQARRKMAGLEPTIDSYDYRILTKSGDVKWVHQASRMVQHGGRPADLVVFVDITEVKRAAAALDEKTRHLQLLIQTSRHPIYVLDRLGKLREHNQAFLDHLGYTKEEVQCLHVSAWDAGREREEVQARIQELLEQPGRVETRHRRRDGSVRDVEVECAPFEEGGEVLILATCHDVTERRQVEDALRQAQQDLRRLNAELEQRVRERTMELELAVRTKDDFLASMSHELRTPLNAVLGITEAVQEGVYGPVSGRQADALGRVEAGGRQLLDLITDILDLVSLDAGTLKLDLELMSVEALCQASVRLVQENARRKGQALTMQVGPGVGAMRADRRRLKQIVVILLGNAIKFTPAGGTIVLQAELDAAGSAVRFTVQDTGIGIASQDLPKLFQSFGQLDARLSRRYGGTGLGLALVQRLSALHGGTVSVESRLGMGSRFSVTIPLQGGE